MSNSIRVLIADDSSVMRRLISQALNPEAGLEIIGAAQNGAEAIAWFKVQHPDIVLLDVDMPLVSGLEALMAIRILDADVPVIMFDSFPVNEGKVSPTNIIAGATDYALKPSNSGHLDTAVQRLRSELIPKIRLLGNRYRNAQEMASPGPTAKRSLLPAPAAETSTRISDAVKATAASQIPRSGRRAGRVEILAIGASTGGPNALASLISQIPADIGIPILIVQHMPPIFTQMLARRLDQCSPLTVREAVDGVVIRKGEIWLARGDFHMAVMCRGSDVVLQTTQAAPENSCRPAVDVLFRSVARIYGANSLGVILTGMGRDGTDGCRALKECGAEVLAQDEASSVVWGMPRSVTEAGLADDVLGLEEIAPAIVSRVRGTQAQVIRI